MAEKCFADVVASLTVEQRYGFLEYLSMHLTGWEAKEELERFREFIVAHELGLLGVEVDELFECLGKDYYPMDGIEESEEIFPGCYLDNDDIWNLSRSDVDELLEAVRNHTIYQRVVVVYMCERSPELLEELML